MATVCMPVTTRSGQQLTDDDLDRLTDEAEAGYDLVEWRPRRGRPFLDADARGHAPRISVRVPPGLRDRAAARAAAEGRSMSDVLRALLEEYVREPAKPHEGSRR